MQANGLNVSRVFLYNLDYGPTSQVPQYAPTPPSVPSVQVSGAEPPRRSCWISARSQRRRLQRCQLVAQE